MQYHFFFKSFGGISKAVLLGCMAWGLSGCESMPVNDHKVAPQEYSTFTPLPEHKRIMKTVKLRWEVRSDVLLYCAHLLGMGKERAFTTPPIACAVWSVDKKECVVVTGEQTTHLAIGHEVRHCFEGHFHM